MLTFILVAIVVLVFFVFVAFARMVMVDNGVGDIAQFAFAFMAGYASMVFITSFGIVGFPAVCIWLAGFCADLYATTKWSMSGGYVVSRSATGFVYTR